MLVTTGLIVISREGVQVDPNKIKAIKEWRKLKNICKLRGFLGLTRYYRRVIKNYAHLIAPLMNLLKKMLLSGMTKQTSVLRN